LAFTLANYGFSGDYQHPRRELDPEKYKDGRTSLYSLLSDTVDPITPREAAELWLEGRHDDGPGRAGSCSDRWSQHYELRLSYENAMLENEGGKAADADMEPGGWIRSSEARRFYRLVSVDGWAQVVKVNKSPQTKRVTSVMVLGTDPYGYCDPEKQNQVRQLTIKVERLGEDAYRAPTDEERAAFKAEQTQAKAKQKTANKKNPAPKLINPDEESAVRLQALWNAKAHTLFDKHNSYGEYTPAEVCYITQKVYSAASKGAYGKAEAVYICEHGSKPTRRYGESIDNSPIVCKVRKTYNSGSGFTHGAYRVIVITDKPRKPLPLNWAAIEQPAEAKPETAQPAGMLF
jgi:hypothetical protein